MTSIPLNLYLSEFYGEHPRDYVRHHLFEQSVTWSGECSGGVASGTGTLKWVRKESDINPPYEDHGDESTGLLRDGRAEGRWVLYRRVDSEFIVVASEESEEGPYADGKRHGRWTVRYSKPDGFGWVDQGTFVHGRKHGNWIKRYYNGESHTVTFVDGKRQ